MQHLPMPVSKADEEKVIELLAQEPQWTPHRGAWIDAYRNYRDVGGSPFSVTAHDFGDGVHDLQYSLYDKRKGSGALAKMRRSTMLKGCPVCGSTVIGSLDHYLPRTHYPEFSIMRANLIPACVHCNSGAKGTTIHGGPPRRFIHPYFDDWAAAPIWFVEVVPPYEAAKFRPRAAAGLPSPRDEIVAFHLDNVLGAQFDLSMGNEWSTLPLQIKARDDQPTTRSIATELELELRVVTMERTTNSWRAALLRGILQDPNAMEHVRQKAIVAVLPPMP